MAWFHDLNSNTQNSIKWFAVEFKYLKELRDDLERIKRDTQLSDQERDYKKARRAWYYVRRCEKRAERNIERVIEDLKQEVQTNPNLIKIGNQMGVSAAELLRAFSFYTGDFQKRLVFLALQFRIRHKYFGNKAKEAEQNIRQIATEAEQYIDTLIPWVYGLELSLRRVEQEAEFKERETRDSINIISDIHKYNPKYIFLCEATSIPWGYKIKEALRNAYPKEPLPNFYRIDPRAVMKVMRAGRRLLEGKGEESDKQYFGSKKIELEEFFKIRIKDRNANILIYDQDWASGESPGSIVALLKNPQRYGLDKTIKCLNVKMNAMRVGREKGFGIHPSVSKEFNIGTLDVLPIQPIPSGILERITSKKDERGGYNFRGRIGNPNVSLKDSLSWIKGLKKKGARIGEELNAEEKKKKQ